MRTGTRTWLAVAVLFGLGASVAVSQAVVETLEDGRWLPYLGCWVETDVPAGPMTCVVPEGQGVAFLTVTDGEVTDRRVVEGDGVERPVGVTGCTGSETARFSSDGYRLYTRSEMTCNGAARSSRGLIAMVAHDQWIEVRALATETDGGSVSWVQRYRRAPSTRVETAGLDDRVATEPLRAVTLARAAASAGVTVDDIIEANARTDGEVVRSWLAEQGEPIRLDADKLVRLADAGVPPEVIDVAVAVSFPDRFQVAREPRADRGYRNAYRWGYDQYGWWNVWSPFGNPYRYDPLYYPYGSYYGYNGYYGPRYQPTSVVIIPSNPVSTPTRGRVVNGRGYTQRRSTEGGDARPSVRTGPTSGTSSATTSRGHTSSSSSKGKAKRRGSGNGGGGG